MTTYREQRGPCVIEAGARDLQDGRHWQPWLRLTRHADVVSASSTFDRLKPVFGTEEAALRYAAELGRSLIDEGSALGPAWLDGKPASRPLNQAVAHSCVYRARKSPWEQGCRTARHMVRALTGLFASVESHGNVPPEARVELYLAAAANHTEFERRKRELERTAASGPATFSH